MPAAQASTVPGSGPSSYFALVSGFDSAGVEVVCIEARTPRAAYAWRDGLMCEAGIASTVVEVL